MSSLMNPVPGDHDLDFLYSCTKEELDPFAHILTDASTNWITSEERYKRHSPDHTKYVDILIADFQRFGGNTLANMFRDLFKDSGGVPYREILTDVCDNQKISYEKNGSVENLECALLEKTLKAMWSKLSEEQRREILKELGVGSASLGGTGAAAIMTAFRMGGFTSYQVMLMLVNSLSAMLFGRGLAFGVNATLTKTLSIVTGPIGWAVGGLWTMCDIASPAMRVTVPATTYVAALRQIKNTERYAKDVGARVSKALKDGKYARGKIMDPS